MLSRNFRLQAVGDVNWLFRNYDFARVSHGIDELMVVNVSRGAHDTDRFCDTVQHIAEKCFIPMTVGGGIQDAELARRFMRSGADKLLINTAFESDPQLCRELADLYGAQCIVAGVDYVRQEDSYSVVVGQGKTETSKKNLNDWMQHLQQSGAGEILLQSVENDGTGMGMDLGVLEHTDKTVELPLILMGGIGRGEHIIEGLRHDSVDAVTTANLYNFIADAFLDVRVQLSDAAVEIPIWEKAVFKALSKRFTASES